MSIKNLMGGPIMSSPRKLDPKTIPTKFGAVVSRFEQLRTVKWGQRETDDRCLDYMSKFFKPEK